MPVLGEWGTVTLPMSGWGRGIDLSRVTGTPSMLHWRLAEHHALFSTACLRGTQLDRYIVSMSFLTTRIDNKLATTRFDNIMYISLYLKLSRSIQTRLHTCQSSVCLNGVLLIPTPQERHWSILHVGAIWFKQVFSIVLDWLFI